MNSDPTDCPRCGSSEDLVSVPWKDYDGKRWHSTCLYSWWYDENKGETKWTQALGDAHDTLCDLEESLGEKVNVEQARLLGRAISACKYWKQPEFDMKFGRGSPRPGNGWECPKCYWRNHIALTMCRNCDEPNLEKDTP